MALVLFWWAYHLLRACVLAHAQVHRLNWWFLSTEVSMEKPWT